MDYELIACEIDSMLNNGISSKRIISKLSKKYRISEEVIVEAYRTITGMTLEA